MWNRPSRLYFFKEKEIKNGEFPCVHEPPPTKSHIFPFRKRRKRNAGFGGRTFIGPPPMIFGYVTHTFLFPYTNCSLIQSHDIFGERRWGSRPHSILSSFFVGLFNCVTLFPHISEISFGLNSPRFCIFSLREITPWHRAHLRFLFCRRVQNVLHVCPRKIKVQNCWGVVVVQRRPWKN